MGRGPPGPRSSGPERQPGNGHADGTGRDSDSRTGRWISAISVSRTTAGRQAQALATAGGTWIELTPEPRAGTERTPIPGIGPIPKGRHVPAKRQQNEGKMKNRFRCEFFVLLSLPVMLLVIIRLPKCFLKLDKSIAASPPHLSLMIFQQSSFL